MNKEIESMISENNIQWQRSGLGQTLFNMVMDDIIKERNINTLRAMCVCRRSSGVCEKWKGVWGKTEDMR